MTIPRRRRPRGASRKRGARATRQRGEQDRAVGDGKGSILTRLSSPRNFRSLFSRFAQADGDRLFAAFHPPSMSVASRTKRAMFFPAHGAPNAFLSGFSVSCHSMPPRNSKRLDHIHSMFASGAKVTLEKTDRSRRISPRSTEAGAGSARRSGTARAIR